MDEVYKTEMLNDKQLFTLFAHMKMDDYPSVNALEEVKDELKKRNYKVQDVLIEITFSHEEKVSLSTIKFSNKTGVVDIQLG